MNVLRRLLNVMSLVCLFFFFMALNLAIDEYGQGIVERQKTCDILASLRAVKDGSDSSPFWKYLPDAEGKSIDQVIASTKTQCERDVEWIKPYGSAKTVFGSSAGFALLVAALNYILFGKATLWNSVAAAKAPKASQE